jgi:hypothetical protein
MAKQSKEEMTADLQKRIDESYASTVPQLAQATGIAYITIKVEVGEESHSMRLTARKGDDDQTSMKLREAVRIINNWLEEGFRKA